MKALKAHLRLHGAVHALWAIAILIAVIAALILMTPNGQSVGDYIAFAASIASLVLAVVAIGQSLISNQSFSETVGTLRQSAANVESASENITNSSSRLSDQTDRIISEIGILTPAVQHISERLDERFDPSAAATPETEEITFGGGETFLNKLSKNGANVALYALIKAFASGKPIDTNTIFPASEENHDDINWSIWDNWVSGFLDAVRIFAPCGIKMEMDDPGTTYIVKSLGQIPKNEVLKRISSRDAVGVQRAIKKLDDQFGSVS